MAARDAGVSKVVFASTGGALVGDSDDGRVSEHSVPKPRSPYGASKLAGEGYCQAFAGAYGLATVILRFGNVYGPKSGHKRGVVNSFVRCLIDNTPFVMHGDGSATRDFLHVDDLCQAITLSVNAKLAPGSIFHVATGIETRVDELAQMLAEIAGRPGHPAVFKNKRAGEVHRNVASVERAVSALGFQALVPLRSGLESTWEWFLEQERKLSPSHPG
jgi:UDP-glucose 4-epimerase